MSDENEENEFEIHKSTSKTTNGKLTPLQLGLIITGVIIAIVIIIVIVIFVLPKSSTTSSSSNNSTSTSGSDSICPSHFPSDTEVSSTIGNSAETFLNPLRFSDNALRVVFLNVDVSHIQVSDYNSDTEQFGPAISVGKHILFC